MTEFHQAFVQRLAQLIATEMNILDPEYLILGGGVLAMADFPLAPLRSQIQQHLYELSYNSEEVQLQSIKLEQGALRFQMVPLGAEKHSPVALTGPLQ